MNYDTPIAMIDNIDEINTHMIYSEIGSLGYCITYLNITSAKAIVSSCSCLACTLLAHNIKEDNYIA